jgi:cell division protein FtsN
MARDYKNAATKKHDNGPGLLRNLLPFITGLALGLLATFIIYLSQQDGTYKPFQVNPEPAQTGPVTPDTPVTEPAPAVPAPAASAEAGVPAPRFDFYNILPNKELSISEWEAEAPVVEEQGPADANSVYILQVGSFKQMEAADQVKAQIAIVGVSADIQRVVINGEDSLYRVRVGPFTDQQKLNEARSRLQQNNIEFMLLKLQADDPRASKQ